MGKPPDDKCQGVFYALGGDPINDLSGYNFV